ncbi:hypothetical protein K1719_024567 [Acacia pycnantha]|nr:hypothetical protein K1719_024567 [Acacia pycnantha]
MRRFDGLTQNEQDTHFRSRDNPFFDGLTRRSPLARAEGQAPLESQGISTSRNVFRSLSDSVEKVIPEETMNLQMENLALSGFSSKSVERSSSERWFNTNQSTPFIRLDIQSAVKELYSKYVGDDCSPKNPEPVGPMNPEPVEGHNAFEAPPRLKIETTYSVSETKENLSSISFPLSAGLYYNGLSPQLEIVESCESIIKLNAYLRERKDDVNAGIPGRFLHAVMGIDNADVGIVSSTIMYAFYLNETLRSDQFCTVPIINFKRANLGSHAELKWLLDSCQIDQSSLIFADEIDLSYYDLFGSLKIVLVKSSKIANRQEKLKHAVVEIFHCIKGDSVYPWVKTVTRGEESSCCTAIAEKFAMYSLEVLASRSFCRLLLAGILLDTANLKGPHCTSKDKYMTSLLLNGAGRFGCNGLYQILKHKAHDVSTLQLADILQRDFKKWTELESADARSLSGIGMSCIGVSIGQLVSHPEHLVQEIQYFQLSEKLKALIIVSGYYNDEKNFKREILVSAESVKLLESMIFFFDFNASRLSLKSLNLPGLKKEMKAFEIDKITPRKTIEHLIEEFVGVRKA